MKKTVFASLDEEINAYELYLKEDKFAQKCKSLAKMLADYEPEEDDEFGFKNTPLYQLMSCESFGFNGEEKSCVLSVVNHCVNHDQIALRENGMADIEFSNHPEAAKVINQMLKIAETDAKVVYQRYH